MVINLHSWKPPRRIQALLGWAGVNWPVAIDLPDQGLAHLKRTPRTLPGRAGWANGLATKAEGGARGKQGGGGWWVTIPTN